MTEPTGSKDELDEEEQEQGKAPSGADPVSERSAKEKTANEPKEAQPKRRAKQAVARSSPKKSGGSTRTAKRASGKSTATSSRLALIVAVTLIAGAGAGWFAHDARAMLLRRQQEAAAEAGEGPCQGWEQQVCDGTGAKSAACAQAKGAAKLLPTAACGAALQDVPGTLQKVKAARADCDKLVTKLCKDIGEDTCKMVTERTGSFPPERCTGMLKNYDQVLSQLKRMEKQGGMGGPHGGPPRARPASGRQSIAPPGGPRPAAQPPTMRQSVPPKK